jgi:acyl-CoA oxidase
MATRDSGGTEHVLPQERAQATFDVEKVTNLLDGNEKATKRRRWFIGHNEGMGLTDRYNMRREDLFKKHCSDFITIHKKFPNFKPTNKDVQWMSSNSTMLGPFGNHYGLFCVTIQTHASEEQKSWWLPKALRFEMIGCYAQTEIGHGSNVRGLQTTATDDKGAQQFILHSPTLKACKWWPGALAKLSTHAIVYAQLFMEGKEYGLHSFLLQIRDHEHKPMRGVELLDMGPKTGTGNITDHGFMRLTQVRIPREFMLARFQQVTPDGKYIKTRQSGTDNIQYSTMVVTRVSMVAGAGAALAKAVTIATRYSAIRTQGFVDIRSSAHMAPERTILDYQTQRYRLFKQMATAYAIYFMGNRLFELSSTFTEGVGSSDSNFAEVMAISGGLKGLCTLMASDGIEDCRKCCGGNGFLLSSGIGALTGDYLEFPTAEGDAAMLMLYLARYLIKALQKTQSGGVLTSTCEYLNVVGQPGFSLEAQRSHIESTATMFANTSELVGLYRYRALRNLVMVGSDLQQKVLDGMSMDDAWSETSLKLVDAARAHCLYCILDTFAQICASIQDAAVRDVMSQLCAVFGLAHIRDQGDWVGVLDVKALKMSHEALSQMLGQLRPNAVALVDAFDFPDRVLNSTIGRFDGKVYEALYEAAQRSAFNKHDPFEGYEDVLRPHLDLEFLKRGNVVPTASKL